MSYSGASHNDLSQSLLVAHPAIHSILDHLSAFGDASTTPRTPRIKADRELTLLAADMRTALSGHNAALHALSMTDALLDQLYG